MNWYKCFSVTVLLALVATSGGFAEDPDTLPSVTSNWSVKEVADAPDFRSPLAIEVAPDGRVFVGEAWTKLISGGDNKQRKTARIERVICFHPDGRRTVVAEDFHAVTGLLYLDGKLYVNHPPSVSVLTLDGDTVTERKELFDLGPEHLAFFHHFPSGFRLGMDGYIYMSVGDKGILDVRGRDGSTVTLHGGGIFRFRPDGTDLEIYARGTRNHLSVAANSQDEFFVYDHDGGAQMWRDHLIHIVDGGNYGYPYQFQSQKPYILPKMFEHGLSPAGTLVYTGARLPEKYHENIFATDWAFFLDRLVVSRKGATFDVQDRERLAKQKEGGLFLPVGIAQAQDGTSFYVTDWNIHAFMRGDQKRGQLLKISYEGSSRDIPIPEWYEKAGTDQTVSVSIDQLIEQGLKHPAKRVRMVAQRRLADHGKSAIPHIVDLLNSSKVPAHAKWHGIWVLDAIDGARSERDLIINLTGPGHPASVRRQAMRQLGTREVQTASEVLVRHLDDENASIRLWAATALGRIGHPASVDPLLNALDESDQFARYAMFHALNRIGRSRPEAWHQIADGLQSETKEIRNGARFAMRDTYRVENVKALSNVIRSGSGAQARVAAVKTIVPLLFKHQPWDGRWWGMSPADQNGKASVPMNRRPSDIRTSRVEEQPLPRSENWEGTSIVRSTLQHVAESGNTSLQIAMLGRISSLPHDHIPSALVDTLLRLRRQPDTKDVAMNILLDVPAPEALPAYLDGLTSNRKQVREKAKKALESIASEVREQVLQKIRASSLSDEVVTQLAEIYSGKAGTEPIRNWHIVGPFERDRSCPFDLNSDPGNDQSFEGKNSTVSWTKATGNREHGRVNLEEVLGEIDHASAFARTTLNVDQEMKTRLFLGSDDGLIVWVNGERVFKDLGTRGWQHDQFSVPVTLNEGKNEMVCKIEEHTGGWQFSVQYIPSKRQWLENHLNGE